MPTFLWAGGWFLHVLYQLAGVRETPWTLSFSPDLPAGSETASYDLAVGGARSRVSWSGTCHTFRRIVVDGVEVPSAVVTGPASTIELERGLPTAPYLAGATALVEGVWGEDGGRALGVRVDGADLPSGSITTGTVGGAVLIRLAWTLAATVSVVTVRP